MAYCEQQGLSRYVKFCGWKRDLPKVYADLDILALTSINEGTPVSIIEAMACSVPVISTDAGSVRELIAGMLSSRQALCGMGNGESRMRNADTKQSLR